MLENEEDRFSGTSSLTCPEMNSSPFPANQFLIPLSLSALPPSVPKSEIRHHPVVYPLSHCPQPITMSCQLPKLPISVHYLRHCVSFRWGQHHLSPGLLQSLPSACTFSHPFSRQEPDGPSRRQTGPPHLPLQLFSQSGQSSKHDVWGSSWFLQPHLFTSHSRTSPLYFPSPSFPLSWLSHALASL